MQIKKKGVRRVVTEREFLDSLDEEVVIIAKSEYDRLKERCGDNG